MPRSSSLLPPLAPEPDPPERVGLDVAEHRRLELVLDVMGVGEPAIEGVAQEGGEDADDQSEEPGQDRVADGFGDDGLSGGRAGSATVTGRAKAAQRAQLRDPVEVHGPVGRYVGLVLDRLLEAIDGLAQARDLRFGDDLLRLPRERVRERRREVGVVGA